MSKYKAFGKEDLQRKANSKRYGKALEEEAALKYINGIVSQRDDVRYH